MTYSEFQALFAPYIDRDGLIIHNNQEWGGGDTAQREGMYAYGMSLAFPQNKWAVTLRFRKSLEKLTASPGNYVRHSEVPGCPDWYHDPLDFSRDQSIPLVVAMGHLRVVDHLEMFYSETKKRSFRAQNGDPWWWPYHMVIWFRAFREAKGIRWYHWLHPLLWFGDLFLAGAAIESVIKSHLNSDFSDDLNFQLGLMQSNVMSTPLGAWARRYYAENRAKNPGTHETWGPASALEYYFSTSSEAKNSGAPPVDVLYNKSGILKNLIR